MKFRELLTDAEVDITGLPLWEGEPVLARVTYGDGREYYMRYSTVWTHFEQLPDQAVAMKGAGGGGAERPTKTQELLAQLVNEIRKTAR